MTRVCKKCSVEKPVDRFVKNKRCTLGVTHQCLSCAYLDAKVHIKRNPASRTAAKAKYNRSERGKLKNRSNSKATYYRRKAAGKRTYNPIYSKEWYQANKPRLIALAKERRHASPGKHKEAKARRRAKKLKATPPWLTDSQKLEIALIYETCPKGYHVDHIIPLNNKDVCGLHVPWNLQHLPAVENIAKGNRLKKAS